jgi:hypothetical protein
MRFLTFMRADIRGAKIDWDIDLDLTPELRTALHPHDAGFLRPGRIRRAFMLGNGKFRAPKHALVFAYPDEGAFLVQVEE